MPQKRKPIPLDSRSALSNGRLLLNGVPADGRSVLGRRFRDHVLALSDHVGGEPTASEDMLIRRAGFLATLCDIDETIATAGEQIDEGRYIYRASALVAFSRGWG